MKNFKTILGINFQLTDEWEQLENIDKFLLDNTVEHFVNKEKNLEFRILFNTKLLRNIFNKNNDYFFKMVQLRAQIILNSEKMTF